MKVVGSSPIGSTESDSVRLAKRASPVRSIVLMLSGVDVGELDLRLLQILRPNF